MRAGGLVLGFVAVGGALALALWPRRSSDDLPDDVEPAGGPLELDWLPILRAIGEQESGRQWGRVGIESVGIAWGYWQANQAAGTLGLVLQRWAAEDPATWSTWAGPDASALEILSSSSRAARLSLNLAAPTWQARLVAAGEVPACRRAQLEVILENYRDPLVPALQRVDLVDLVSAGLALDRAIQQGTGAALAALARVALGGSRDDRLGAFFAAVLAPLGAGDRAAVVARANRVWAALEPGSGDGVA